VAAAALPTWGGAYRQEDDTMRIDDLRISTRLELGFGVLGLMILAMVVVGFRCPP
jgi:hypothetical protein